MPIDLAALERQEPGSALQMVRGEAITNYARLERSLCGLLSLVSGMEPDVSEIVFFKITNADARNKIISKLVKRKFGAQFSAFWNSYFKELSKIDRTRNEIVHWTTVQEIGTGVNEFKLMAPAIQLPSDVLNGKSISDLQDFSSKCDYFARAVNMFRLTQNPDIPPDVFDKEPWLAKFQQPVAYPPAADDLLSKGG